VNDPFPCETKVEGVQCAGHATHVYRSASATRLICDECATAYRLAAKGPRKLAVVEFSLLELIPAREYLLGQVETMRMARDSAEDVARKAKQTASDATALARGFESGREKAMTEAQEAWANIDKMHQSLARAVALSRVHRNAEDMTNRWVLWGGAMTIALAVTAQIIWGGYVGPLVFGGGAFLVYGVVRFVVIRAYTRPALAKLNASAEDLQ
jgi:hypothetical protein